MRNRTLLSGPVAHVIQRIVLDEESFEPPTLPPVIGGTWGDVALDGLWGPLSLDGPNLIWEVNTAHDATGDARSMGARLRSLRNEPASLHLADGSRVQAQFGHWKRWGGRPGMQAGDTCEFIVWNVEGPRPARWVGKLRGGGFRNENLRVAAGIDRFSAMHMRLEGNYVWHILDRGKDGEAFDVVIDAGPSPLDQEALGIDFNALQFSFGTPMQLDALVALDEPGNVVGCAGVCLGGNRATKKNRHQADGPVPDEVRDECWVPVFFRRLAKAMTTDDLPWGVACNAYLDSVSDSTIDGKYLKLHVALEAFANALLKRDAVGKAAPRRLVRDSGEWVAWVKDHADGLRAMVAEGERADVFINKVISAMNPASSSVVAGALARLEPPLVVDEAALDELDKRNIPAHNFTMNRPGVDYDVERDVERVDILRSLLVALVARACGYDGAIAGWVTGGAAGWKPQPGWWPAPAPATEEEARMAFSCERPGRTAWPRVFRPSLRTKKMRSTARLRK